MANRLVGNVYIVDSGSISLTSVYGLKVQCIALYATDTTGELMVSSSANTADTIVHIRANQGQPFTYPLYLGGVQFEDIRIQKLTAGTAFFYLC